MQGFGIVNSPHSQNEQTVRIVFNMGNDSKERSCAHGMMLSGITTFPSPSQKLVFWILGFSVEPEADICSTAKNREVSLWAHGRYGLIRTSRRKKDHAAASNWIQM